MATKDSGEIATNSNYALGDYSFRIERSSVPGSTNDKIEAICTDKDGKNARKSIQVPSATKYKAWYVEANDTEVSVYVLIQGPGDGRYSPFDLSPAQNPIPAQGSPVYTMLEIDAPSLTFKYEEWYYCNGGAHSNGINSIEWILCGSEQTTFIHKHKFTNRLNPWYNNETETEEQFNYSWTYDNKTVWYSSGVGGMSGGTSAAGTPDMGGGIGNRKDNLIAWTMIYGTPTSSEDEEMLVARFPIDLEDAGGVGPDGGIGGGWTDPGDYDEDWEEGDPTHTLYVEVTGALSGRHNDPIVDPSYSYIPADKDTVKDYGCGGDGGHGGGGGAGASTVVIHKFATNQANSKEVIAIARRHGYGSGGGKGGKGGDGCILVYY